MNKMTLLNRLILFLIIMNSGGIPFVKNLYITFLILILIAFNILIQKKYNFTKPIIGIMLIIFLLLFNFIVTFDNQEIDPYVIYFLYFLIALLFYNFYNNDSYNFVIDLEKILKIFLYFAIFSFLMQFLIENKLSIFSHNGYEAQTFMSLVYYPKVESSFILLRNQGLFWEPGVLELYMNLLFFINTNIKKNNTIALLSAIIIVTTFSTTGLLILTIQLLVLAFNIKHLNLIKKLLMIPLFLFIAAGMWFVLSDNINDKLEGSSKRSSYARTFDALTAVNIIQAYPFFGIGLSDQKYYGLLNKYGYKESELFDSEIDKRGSTNAILKIFYQFGVVMALLLLVFFYKQQIFPNHQKLFFIIIFLGLLSEPIFMSPFIFIFIVSSLNILIRFQGMNHQCVHVEKTASLVQK